MTDAREVRAVQHTAFTETRLLGAERRSVYGAFADAEVLRRWFRLPGHGSTYTQDFRVGGGERARSTFRHLDGRQEHLEYRSRYLELVPDRRIVYGYESLVDDVLRWTSLVTVELTTAEGGTLLKWTEQAAFLVPTGEGETDLAHLRGAVRLRLNGLPAALAASR